MSQGSLATTMSHITKGPDTKRPCHQGPAPAPQQEWSRQGLARSSPRTCGLVAPAVPRALRGFGRAPTRQPQPHRAQPWVCRLRPAGHQELAARTCQGLVGSGSTSRGSPGTRAVPQGSARAPGLLTAFSNDAQGTERSLGALAGDGKLSGAGPHARPGPSTGTAQAAQAAPREPRALPQGRGRLLHLARGSARGTDPRSSPLASAAPRAQSPGPGLAPRCPQGAAEGSPPAGAGAGR